MVFEIVPSYYKQKNVKMKQIIVTLCLIPLFVISGYAQMIIDNVHLKLNPTTFLHVVDLSLKETSHLENDGAVIITGDINCESGAVPVHVSGSGILNLEGDEQQQIFGNLDVERCDLNNPFGLAINGVFGIYEHLKFSNGIIAVSGNSRVQFKSSATHSGASDLAHVNGNVSKMGNQKFVFPLGDGQHFRPLRIAGSNTIPEATVVESLNEYNVSYVRQANDNWIAGGVLGIRSICNSEYWRMNSNVGNASIKVGIPANSGVCIDSSSNPPFLAAYHSSGWVAHTASLLTDGITWYESEELLENYPLDLTYAQPAMLVIDATAVHESVCTLFGNGVSSRDFVSGPTSEVLGITPLITSNPIQTINLSIHSNDSRGAAGLELKIRYNQEVEITGVDLEQDGQVLPLHTNYYEVVDGYKLKFYSNPIQDDKQFITTNLVAGKLFNDSLGNFEIIIPMDVAIVDPKLSIRRIYPSELVIVHNSTNLKWEEPHPMAGVYAFSLTIEIDGNEKEFDGQFIVQE